MTGNQIRQLLRESSTKPFTIHVEGKSFRISHPEFAGVTGPEEGSNQTLIIYHHNDNGWDLVDISLIARVEVGEPQAS